MCHYCTCLLTAVATVESLYINVQSHDTLDCLGYNLKGGLNLVVTIVVSTTLAELCSGPGL